MCRCSPAAAPAASAHDGRAARVQVAAAARHAIATRFAAFVVGNKLVRDGGAFASSRATEARNEEPRDARCGA